jgi:CcmD family protein
MMRNRIVRHLVAAVFITAIAAAVAAPLLAQAQQPQTPPGQNEFVPVKDLPQQENLPAAPLVMGAYAFVWVTLVVYVWSLSRRVGKVQTEIDDLRKRAITKK